MTLGQTTRFFPQQLPWLLRTATVSMLVLLTGCVSRTPSQLPLDDTTISRKIVGEWEGSALIYNPRAKANETFAFKNKIKSDGTFSTNNRLYDSTGRFVREMGWGGTYIVKDGAVVCTITYSSEKEHISPPKIEVEPVVRLTETEMEIVNGSGLRIASKRISPSLGNKEHAR